MEGPISDDEPSQAETTKLHIQLLRTHPTRSDPLQDAKLIAAACLDGCIVPSESTDIGARVAFSHVVVLDDFVDAATLTELRHFLLGTEVDASNGDPSSARGNETPTFDRLHLPTDLWERKTADMDGASATWGARDFVLKCLAEGRPSAIVEVQSRLCKLYPEVDIGLLPSSSIQVSCSHRTSGRVDADLSLQERCKEPSNEHRGEEGVGDQTRSDRSGDVATAADNAVSAGDCSAILANASVEHDEYRYHVDADPSSFPPSPWTECFGDYVNGEPGKPLLVTMLLYLNDEWERDWGGETLFIDGETDVGLCVRPKPGRVVLMDQDVLHRVSVPSKAAGGRPRLSLVWKLVFLPKHEKQECCILRREWGRPAYMGSAARVQAVKQSIANEVGKRPRDF